MKQSQLFTKTEKKSPAGEVSLNAQLLIRAGYVDKLMAGVYTFLPLGWRVMKKIENIIREEMNAIGGQEIFMPSLQPKENWETTGRWQTMDDLYKLKDSGGRDFALGATHEEVIAPLMKRFVSSYKDLPFAAYQIQNKFRMELRSKSGILRGREFIMKDLYSFHLAEADLDAYYEKASGAYEKIFQRAGIGEVTYKTFASGSSFSKYSHEYQAATPAGEDLIYVCEKCRLAVNKEIIGEVDGCPQCGSKNLREEKSIEVGNIFKLKTRYSEPFDLKVTNESGQKQAVLMGCYGIGLGRLMGTIVEVSHDEKGIVWPQAIAPFQAHLISLGKNAEAEKIYVDLLASGVEVLFDDREETAGNKFADADLLGMPERIVVSEKSLRLGGVEIKQRRTDESRIISAEKLKDFLKQV